MININELEDDAANQQALQTAQFSLEELVQTGNNLEALKAQRDHITKVLEELDEAIRHLETELMPDALKNLGLKEITLASGAKISLVEVVSASITDDNRAAAHGWLRANGHGDIIKNNVTVSFGKGEDTFADVVVRQLLAQRDSNVITFGDIQQKEAVHPSTLKAFVKEQLSKGGLPGELFKLYVGQAVKITK